MIVRKIEPKTEEDFDMEKLKINLCNVSGDGRPYEEDEYTIEAQAERIVENNYDYPDELPF